VGVVGYQTYNRQCSRGHRHALAVQQRLKDHYIPEIVSIKHEGKLVTPPTPVPWYPDELAWQMTTPKQVVRKYGPFKSFQQFLVSETSVGNISRQEVVSMIPPILLDVRPAMTVLDLCAAPGSKSAQLIEMVHSGEEARMKKMMDKISEQEGREASPEGKEIQEELGDSRLMEDWADNGRATGLLIANDVDYRRAHMLIHQMKRLNSPNLVVTNHDATMFPSIKLPTDPAAPNRYLKFDRILADVPCSGDGTCRKNMNIWKDWSPVNGLGLHLTQVKILVRALQMLKVGGRVVYSTCSMNPIENEAVVAAAVDRCGGTGKVEIVDSSLSLPELKRRPGLKQWQVMDKKGRLWRDWKSVEEEKKERGEDNLGRLVPSMFSPGNDVPLDRCLRIYPHLQDTGGFFIVALQKKSEIRARPENPAGRTAATIRQEVSAQDGTTPSAPMPSIIDAVDAITARTANGGEILDHVQSLDSIAPPVLGDVENYNPSGAARMNQENLTGDEQTSRKRALDAENDAYLDTKRPRFREEDDEAAPSGEANPQVHWPPPPAAAADRPMKTNGTGQDKRKAHQPFEEPFKYLDPNHQELQTIYDFYQLDSRFPRDRFMVRNAMGEPAKTVYYTTTLAKDILSENEGKGMKFVHCGVKMFVKQDVQKDGQCKWRIQTDGLQLVEPWVGQDRVVRLHSRKTLHKLLIELFPKVTGVGWSDLGEIGERVKDIELGCCVLRVESGEGDDAFSERMVLPIWRSLHSLNLMLPKEDRRAMLLRLYNDNSPLVDFSQERRTAEAAANQGAIRAAEDVDTSKTNVVASRAADLEEIAAEEGEPSDDEEDGDDDMDAGGGVQLDPDDGVTTKPNTTESQAKLQIELESKGVRERGVDTEGDIEVNARVLEGALDSGTMNEAN